jgi:hypothetical protein
MKLVTIQDPEFVRAELQKLFPKSFSHHAYYNHAGWNVCVLTAGMNPDPTGNGVTPHEAIADLRAKHAANDPLAKLRNEAEKAGYELKPKQTELPVGGALQ